MAKRERRGGGIHELPSGMLHTADSLAGGPNGQFVDWFGAPPSPESKDGVSADKGIVGKAPQLQTRWMRGNNGRTN